ncbi:hypothetical protein T552_02690 [Pneumocystis carinii B80]|uniref:Protein transport protein sec16 n=1 Tax=Pneumocystis carinii (strain B80) TaxID=1408658 RepID=A0A0W4ZE87_PNEC8|nr:hypothetical protein T552_02690 [Pneumocystis carinii B80]KTW26683.1 hypothetical protein T552_02690 [Pneumocystis carinii B80]
MKKNIQNNKEQPVKERDLYNFPCPEDINVDNNKRLHTRYSKAQNILTQNFSDDYVCLLGKTEFCEKSKILPQFMPQKLIENKHFDNFSNVSSINHIQNTNNNYNFYKKEVQTSKKFVSDKIENKNGPEIQEATPKSYFKGHEDSRTIISSQKAYELNCQSQIDLEPIPVNPDEDFFKNDIKEGFKKSNEKISAGIFEKDSIPLRNFFLKQQEEEMTEDNKDIVSSDSQTEFDYASTLFKTVDNDEYSFFKNTFDTLTIQDEKIEDYKNNNKNNNISSQVDYNDIWKAIGEDTDFLPDDVICTENDIAFHANNMALDTETMPLNKNMFSSLENSTERCVNQLSNIPYPYLNSHELDKSSSSKKPDLMSHTHQSNMHIDNTQSYSLDTDFQANILNTSKTGNIFNQSSSEIFSGNNIPSPTHSRSQQCIHQQSYQQNNNYFSTINSENNEIATKSYISIKGGYLSPYDLPVQFIPKFRRLAEPASNKYSDIQKYNNSSDYIQTNINTFEIKPSKSLQNIPIDVNVTNNSKILSSKTSLKDLNNEKDLLNYTSADTSIPNANTYFIQQTSKTYEEKAEEKNKMFQDLPIEFSKKLKVSNKTINKTGTNTQDTDFEIQHSNMQYTLADQKNIHEIYQNSHEVNQDVFNITDNKAFLSDIPFNINSQELNAKKIDMNNFSLNNIKDRQNIHNESHIQENALEPNDFLYSEAGITKKNNLYYQHSLESHYSTEKKLAIKENTQDLKKEKSINIFQKNTSTSNYEPYTSTMQKNLQPSQYFPLDIDNSYLRSEKQDNSVASNIYTSFVLPSQPMSFNIQNNNSILDISENNSKRYNLDEKIKPIYRKDSFENSSYPILVWGFGGKIITIFPDKTYISDNSKYIYSNSSHTSGTLKISNIRSYFQNSELLHMTIPGPLFSISKNTNKTRKKEAIKWLGEKIQSLELIKDNEEDEFFSEKILLWKIIYILLDNSFSSDQFESIHSILNLLQPDLQFYNKEKSNFTITADFMNSSSNLNTNTQEISSYTVTQESLEQIKLYLLSGAKNDAIQFCLDRKLWSHALLISNSMGKEVWKYVAKEFIRSEINVNNKSLQSLKFFYEALCEDDLDMGISHSFFNNNVNIEPNKTKEFHKDYLDNWKETLVMILSNPSDKDSNIIFNLGKLLIKNNYIIPGHICFLLAKKDSVFSMLDIHNSDLILLGGDHINNPSSFYHDLDNIILNEILELYTALKSQSPFYGYAHLQAYKFYYATILADLGYISEAQRYCESISDIIKKYSKGSPFFHLLFVQQFQEFSSRLLTYESLNSMPSWFGKKMSKPKLDSFWGSIENKFSKFVTGETSSIESQEILNNDSNPFEHLAEKISHSKIHSQTNLEALNTCAVGPYLIQDEFISQPNHQEKLTKTCQNNYDLSPNLSLTTSEDPNIFSKDKKYNHLACYQPMPKLYETSNQESYCKNVQYYKESIISENNSENILNREVFKENGQIELSRNDNLNYLESSDTQTNDFYNTKSELKNLSITQLNSEDSYNVEPKSQSPKNNRDENANSSWFSKWWGKKEQSKEKKIYKAKLGEDNSFVYDTELKKWINKKDSTSISEHAISLPPPPKKAELSHSTNLIAQESHYNESNKISSNTITPDVDSMNSQLSTKFTHKPIVSNDDALDDLLKMASEHSLANGNTQTKTLTRKIKAKNTKNKYVDVMNLNP